MRKYSDRGAIPQQPDQALTEVMLGECVRGSRIVHITLTRSGADIARGARDRESWEMEQHCHH